ncbi:MAG: preprotein translocase subunit YajC [Armatimonadota bacterium]
MLSDLSPETRMWLLLIVGYGAVIGLFWLLMIKPRRDAQRKHLDLIGSLRKGDKVVTAGGIHGRVSTVRDDTVTLEVAEGTRLKLDKAAVRKRQDEDE